MIYYVMAIKVEGRWLMEFGSWDRLTAIATVAEYKEAGVRVSDLRLLLCENNSVACIDEMFDNLNRVV